ncbi:MAG: leucine-rich repeat domain-containing protein [Microcystaceae cyanobacterium]
MTNEELLQHIEQAKREGVTKLDLSNNQLSKLPPEIAQLPQLQQLDLSNNQLSKLPPEIAQLSQLQQLDLSNNQLSKLSPEIAQLSQLQQLDLSNNQLSELPPEIAQLSQLQTLDLSNNHFSDSQISYYQAIIKIHRAKTEGVTYLDLSNNQLSELPQEIAQLSQLQQLDLSNNQLSELPPIFAQLSQLQQLDLSNNQLSKLPPEIAQLPQLQGLYLSNNQLSELPPIFAQLSQLQQLNLSNSKLSELPPEIAQLSQLQQLDLSNNQLSELSPEIAQLSQLQRLYLSNSKLSELPPEIAQLSQLQQLDLSNNQLSELPPEIAQLSQLQQLDLSNNQLSELPQEIAQLSQLQGLYLSNNQLRKLPQEFAQLSQLQQLDLSSNHNHFSDSRISYYQAIIKINLAEKKGAICLDLSNKQLSELPPEIAQLSRLQTLYLGNNKLSKLPPEIAQLSRLQYLDLSNNKLPIPPEILEKTKQPQSIINYYLSETKQPLHEIKMLLVGEGGVGKTSLVKRLLDQTYNPKENKTEGINIRPWPLSVNENTIKINVWDFGGQEIMHATHQFFLTKRSIYILVLNARADEEANRIEYWLKIIDSFSDNSPVIVVRNKIDQGVLDLDIKGLKQKYENIITFLDTSCDTGDGIEKLQQTIIKTIETLDHVNDLLPLKWFNIKQQLEQCKQDKLDYMPYSKYVELCQAEEITETDDQKTLIYLLHHLGVVLNFQDDPRLSSENVLNPEWVTQAVYTIINDRTLILDHHGALPYSELNRLLDPASYPSEKHIFLMDIMKKFELCFTMEEDNKYLIPEIIPKQEPDTGEWNNCLNFQYHYPVLPNSIISRFIVNANQYISNKTYWRTGVILKYGTENNENKARIKADKEDRIMFIAIKGNEPTRRELLSIIRSHFERIHKSLPGLVPDIREYIVKPEISEIPISYNHLLQLEAKGIQTHLPENYPEELNVSDLLDGYEASSQRRQRQQTLSKEGTNFIIYNDINNSQSSQMENKNINQSNSGTGDNVGGDKITTNLNSTNPIPPDDTATDKNTLALILNTRWVQISTGIAILLFSGGYVINNFDIQLTPKPPDTTETSP